MEREIIFSKSIEIYFEILVDILFEKKYFGFREDAKKYVREIVLFIEDYNFEVGVREPNKKFQQFGKFYIKYKANQNTTWYIFFDRKENRFLINHILNNHDKDFPELL